MNIFRQWLGYLRWRFAGDGPRARNEQRKVLQTFLNASAIGSLAGAVLDSAQKSSKFDLAGAIFLVCFGVACLIVSYVVAGRFEKET